MQLRPLSLAHAAIVALAACGTGDGAGTDAPQPVPTAVSCADAPQLMQQAIDDRRSSEEQGSDQKKVSTGNRARFFGSLAIIADLKCRVASAQVDAALQPALEAAREAEQTSGFYESAHKWGQADFIATQVIALLIRQLQPGARDPLVGAWWIVETRITTPDSSRVDRDPERGLYIFTESHFSNMLVQGPNPREPFPPNPTPEQRLAAYDPFIADAGSYVRTDSTLITRNRVAKVPNVMDSAIEYRYRLVADTLMLTFSDAWAPPGGQITYRLIRMERDSS